MKAVEDVERVEIVEGLRFVKIRIAVEKMWSTLLFVILSEPVRSRASAYSDRDSPRFPARKRHPESGQIRSAQRTACLLRLYST